MAGSLVPYVENELRPPFLLITCGLPATLKTTVASYIAGRKGCQVLSTDAVRRELLAGEDIYDEAIAGDEAKRGLVYEELFRRAAKESPKNSCLILDGTFYTGALRRRAAALAAAQGLPLVILETACPPEAALARIAGRTRTDTASNAITEQAYRENERGFEPVDLDGLERAYPTLDIIYLVVDTTDVAPESWRIMKESNN